MDIRVVNKNFAVAPQIAVDDITAIKELGYVAVINNRPDGEVEGQPLTNDIKSKALEAGLEYYDLPILSGTLPPEAIAATKSLLREINGPAFARLPEARSFARLEVETQAHRVGHGQYVRK